MTSLDAGTTSRLNEATDRLAAAAAAVADAFAMQIRVAVNVLRNAVQAMAGDLSRRTLSDVEFALGDLRAAVDELPPEDAEVFEDPMATITGAVEELGRETALPTYLQARIAALREKAEERARAIEREPYRPPEAPPEPLPHEPRSLRIEAVKLRAQLRAFGFAPEPLDRLIQDPEEFRLSQLRELVEELDVIAGR
ncbi:MAG: hypothetical protein WBX15_13480 [Thermoanaerobaculia bacterium]